MSLRKIINNDNGLTHTLEAVLGAFLIIGTMMFMTTIVPHTAQKTGEYSKVQLVDIGRDALNLVELAPLTDIFSNYSRSQGVNRTYTLVANRTFVRPGDSINFTVYYIDTNDMVKEILTLEKTVLGLDQQINMTTIQGYKIWSFSTVGEYNIRAVDSINNPTQWSNYVTITVGHYFLDTDVNGIFENGDKNVSGIVYDTNWIGVPNLSIQILDYRYNCYPNSSCPSFATTSYGRTIENFDSIIGWKNSSGSNLSLNYTVKKEGSSSISINGVSNFWIKKINNSGYKLLQYDNLSFDFFANTAGEKIDIELSKNSTSNKLIWNNIDVKNVGWNGITIQLKCPDIIVGNITTQDIDTINISVSNISADNYFFDNLTVGTGSFYFMWPSSSTGTYYIRAIDSSGNTSNRHRIIYSGNNPDDLGILCCDDVIYETDSINITLYPNPGKDLNPIKQFNINQIFYNQYDQSKIHISDPIPPDNTIVTFTAYTAGDYYIFYGNVGQGGGDPAKAAKTNSILIRVLPLQTTCILGDCKPKCAGLDMTSLSLYLRLFMPPYINYNLYLINPDGTICKDCPEFKEIINGYPTDEAVTVNKIFHIRTLNGEFLRELRMVLWYK